MRSGGDCRTDTWSANQCRCSRESKRINATLAERRYRIVGQARRLPWQAERLPYKLSRSLLRAFFEGGGAVFEMGKSFAGEMERAGDQDWSFAGARFLQR